MIIIGIQDYQHADHYYQHANQSQAAQMVDIELVSYCQQVIERIYSSPNTFF